MRKSIYFLIAIAVAVVSCSEKETFNYYGEKIEASNALTADEFLTEMNGSDSSSLKMEATIIETCEKKGCWMTLDLGDGQEMRVTFKDYGFFVPTDSVEGRPVVIEGFARKTVTDVETLKHFAEDAGKSESEIAQITEPKKELTFVATGVAIKDVQE